MEDAIEREKKDPTQKTVLFWELTKYRLNKKIPSTLTFEERKTRLVNSEEWNGWIHQNNDHLLESELTEENIQKEIDKVGSRWGMELMKKMTSQNIDTFLEGQKAAMEYEFKESRENKIFLGIVVLLFMIFIIVLVFLLGDKPDILEKVLYTIGGLIVGAFGGYGFGKTKRNDE